MFLGKVTEGSLFKPTRRKRQTTPGDDFVPLFFDELNITDAHRMICEDNRQCIFDLVATGDVTIAVNTLDSQKESNATLEVLSMSM